jgi:Protein of unknown function (DUF3995)
VAREDSVRGNGCQGAVPGGGLPPFARTPAASENHAMEHLSRQQLAAGLSLIRDSPRDGGRVVLVVRRPVTGERDLPGQVTLDEVGGLAGDNWLARGSRSTPDGLADPQRQVTVMNSRVAELVAGGTDRMPLAGDQLFIDLDLSVSNLPAGSLLAVGQAVLRVSEAPHLGCAKFVERFGAEAMRFVNSRAGRQLRLRGMNTRVVVPGTVRLGDLAERVPASSVRGALMRRAGAAGAAAATTAATAATAGAATASAGLLALGALHAAWGAGSAWPFPDRSALADAVIGADNVPGPAACFAVSAALAAASGLVAPWPRSRPALRRLGVSGVIIVLAGRGGLGLAGRTRLVSRRSVSRRFARLDRRVYSPLCLALAALSALSVRPAAGRGGPDAPSPGGSQ